MGVDELGPWQPLGLGDVVRLFAGFPARWWITGGLALELHLGRSWRAHEDSDVSLLRQDAPALRHLLAGWDLCVAAAGSLSPWDGAPPSAEANHNNVRCRTATDQPWCLDVTIGDGDGDCWVFRRDPALRVPWDEAVLHDREGVPYLAPELQLLFKNKNARPKDDVDAREVIPELTVDRRRRLRHLLPDDHPWQALVERPGGRPCRT